MKIWRLLGESSVARICLYNLFVWAVFNIGYILVKPELYLPKIFSRKPAYSTLNHFGYDAFPASCKSVLRWRGRDIVWEAGCFSLCWAVSLTAKATLVHQLLFNYRGYFWILKVKHLWAIAMQIAIPVKENPTFFNWLPGVNSGEFDNSKHAWSHLFQIAHITLCFWHTKGC